MGLLSDLFYGITGAKKLENMGLFTPVAMHRDTNDEYKVVEAALYDEKQKDNYKVDSVPFDINIGEVIEIAD